MSVSQRIAMVFVVLALVLSLIPNIQSFAEQPAANIEALPPVPQDDSFFGIVQAIHDPGRAAAAGAHWERLVVWWSGFQPGSAQDWQPSSWFKRELLDYEHSKGIETVGVVLHTPTWAARDTSLGPISPPRNLDLPFDHPDNYWGQFMMHLASEYAGLVDTWILWNEPDLYRETYANWAGSIQEFARMQIVGYQAVKKANPNAKVVLSGTTYWWDLDNNRPQFFESLLPMLLADPGAAANNNYFDAVAVHQYSNPLNSFAVPTLYRRIMQKYGVNKPVWLVESNTVPYDDPILPLSRSDLRASLEEQASYVIQSIAMARAAGVERFSIYKMRDEEPENNQYFGLTRNDGSLRPAYIAYQVAARELANVTSAQYFWSGSATPPTNDEITALLASAPMVRQFIWPGALNGVRMTRGQDRITVLWNVTAAPLPVGIPSSVMTATVVDKRGQRQPLVRAEDGAFHLTLAAATNNTDLRTPSLILTGGDPLILIEPGAAKANDPYPRIQDACWGVPGALVLPNTNPADTWVAPTGYAVSGPWLTYMREHGDVNYLGYPRSPVVADPANSGQCVQFFQRLVLEWHPENPAEYRIQRRLLTPLLGLGEPAAVATQQQANGKDYWYFPKGSGGLGHAVSNYAPDGSWTGFKNYFDNNGHEDSFGYPMEAPVKRLGADGVEHWTQRFQAAIMEYHQEYDKDGVKPEAGLPWRNWTVQLRLLGDEYLLANIYPFIVGDPSQHRPVLPAPTP